MNTHSITPSLPLIDISIVTYNSSQWVDIFFRSILKQNYPTKLINILITDNESMDNTIELCYEFSNKYVDKFNGINIYKRPNLGFGSGHNNNLVNSQADYFLVSNVDLEFEYDAIVKAINTAIADDDDVASWEFRQKPFEHPKYYNPVTLEIPWSSHACILFKRSALESVKGYEEKIFLYGEDVELSFRLRDNGFRIKYCPSSVCWHYTYKYAGHVKQLQFLGNILSNSYIRLRYGSWRQILAIPLLYLKLWLLKPTIDNQKKALIKILLQLLINAPYFLTTRKKSKQTFNIYKWDYSLIRDGAFYSYYRQVKNCLPLVSIIIRTYKGRLSYLKEAIACVLNQTYDNIELVVVEDGSDEARDYLEQIGKNSKKLKVVYQSEPKLGRCHTGNIGLSLTTGQLIVFLDDDDLFFADHIEVLTNELLAHPEVAATYSISWEVTIKLISLEPLVYQEILHRAIYKQPFSRLIMLHHNYIPINSILFNRKLYDYYGGFDESLDNLEDWNLWTRYCLNDNFLFIEKTTSMYRISDSIKDRMERQKSLDSYYKLAVEKQKNMRITVTPKEITDFYEIIAHTERMNIINNLKIKSKFKNFVFKFKFFKNIYYFLSAIKQKTRFK
ncbi:MAG: glycosyltransferase [Sphaerospermopsis sp. SIO1G1]|nr:glycosyltransferase [Sphaerospermopsis sp. SIO1G1]